MIEELKIKAKDLRRATFEMVLAAGQGHLGGSLSCVEILLALYCGGVLRYDPSRPDWGERDRFVLSKAHGGNALLVLLAELGFFPKAELSRFLKDGALLGGHTDRHVPGIEVSGGSLGHGLGVASGIALGAKLDKKDWRTYVLLGDGESQEGSIWEAAMFAAQQRLGNLVAITDRNGLGSEDYTENTSGLEPLPEKWRAFGWEVSEVDGHSFESLLGFFEDLQRGPSSKPKMLIAKTVKGKGISFLENHPKSHHTIPKGEDIETARRDLL